MYLAQKSSLCLKKFWCTELHVHRITECKSDCSPQNSEGCEQKSVQKVSNALDPVGRVSGAVTRCYGNEQNMMKCDNLAH